MHRARTHHGFSLLELLVVLAIGATLLAVVPTVISGIGLTTELRGASRQLAAGLRSARNQAITTRREAALELDIEARVARVSGIAKAIRLPTDDDVSLSLYTAQAEQIDDTKGRIRFFPDGSSTGGYVALLDGRVEYRVNVDWLTGRIKIEELDIE